jgi:pimeloyl-ACP methyl ester carboxylesterase
MDDIVLLPATAPGDTTYGTMPERLAACPQAVLHHVRFPTLVWYNAEVRRQAIAQIAALPARRVILVGFSKSGLGAWNIARSLPERVAGTLIFDAPTGRQDLPSWGTAPFYADHAAWLEDLPARTIAAFRDAMPPEHRLVLISGAAFHADMQDLAARLTQAGVPHLFLPRPTLRHHWNSGWLEEGLLRLLAR